MSNCSIEMESDNENLYEIKFPDNSHIRHCR